MIDPRHPADIDMIRKCVALLVAEDEDIASPADALDCIALMAFASTRDLTGNGCAAVANKNAVFEIGTQLGITV